MKAQSAPMIVVFLAISGLAHAESTKARPSATALNKVLEMLNDMADTGIKDMQDEQIEFAKFEVFCDQEEEDYVKEIASQGTTIDEASADIGVLTVEIKKLGKEVLALGQKIEKQEGEVAAATAERKETNKEYLETSQDYEESIDAIAAALTVLTAQDYDRTGKNEGEMYDGFGKENLKITKFVQEDAFLQVSESRRESLRRVANRKGMPSEASYLITSFLDQQDKAGSDSQGPPEANAYEFQSGSIIEMLKKLQAEFKGKLSEVQKREMNSKHAYDMVVSDLRASIELAKKNRYEKKVSKDNKEETVAKLQHVLSVTESEKADDEKSLKDLKVDCKTKSSSFVYKQQLREDEIAAINQALEILGGKPVKYSVHMEELRTSTALTQFLASSGAKTKDAQDRQRVRDFIAQQGASLKSKNLILLAEKLQADPFAPIKELVSKMLTKLLNEAHDDADHQGFCDMEVGKNKITRDKLTQDLDALTSSIEGSKATIIRLTEELKAQNKEIKGLEKAMKDATALRMSENKNNEAKIAEAKDAGAMVEKATMVLKNFYEMAAGNTADAEARSVNPKMGTPEWEVLGTQKPYTPEPRATFGKVFTGQQETAGGVVALLEVIQSDFMTVVTSTTQAETDAKQKYDDYMDETRRSVSVKERDNELLEADRVDEEARNVRYTEEKKTTQKQIAAADDYWENLKPQCFDSGTTFEERQKAIQQEIDSLEEALKLLKNAL